MPLTIEMHDPGGTIMREIADSRIKQAGVAITYAFAIAQLGDKADWPAINRAIQERWKGRTALKRIKEAAWKQIDEWKAQDVPPG
jgi:hypothetical protein